MHKSEGKILLAGSTGYLGRHIVAALLEEEADFRLLARRQESLQSMGVAQSQIHLAQVTDAQSLTGCCQGVDVVISCVGITRQKDGLCYRDVDYQANLNLLREAESAGVRKFIYVSAFKAQLHRQVRLLDAKERFAERLLRSEQLQGCVIRPNGFFSDMEAFVQMAKAGRVYLFGDGSVRVNPIHGADLARCCLAAIGDTRSEIDVGGPDVLSGNEIAALAFAALQTTPRVTRLPDGIRRVARTVATSLPEQYGGAAEFFLTVMAQDMIAPCFGTHHLRDYFCHLSQTV